MKKRKCDAVVLLLLCSCTAFAQQVEMKKDSLGRHPDRLKSEQQETPIRTDNEGFIEPNMNLPTESTKPVIQQDSMTFRVSVPEDRDVLTPTSRLGTSFDPFSRDYERLDRFRINGNSFLSTYSLQHTYPTMGTHIQAGLIYTYAPNERWELSGGLFTSKYTMPSMHHGAKGDFGFSGSAAYRINDYLRIMAFGQYSIYGERNATQGYLTPMYPHSSYGLLLEIKINEHIEVHAGAERSYNPMRMRWETTPVICPVIKLNRKKR